MARRTVTAAIDQIGPPVPLHGLRRVRHVGIRITVKQQVPARHQGPHIHGEGQLGFRHFGLHWLLCHQVGVQGLHVLIADLGKGRVREGRVQVASVLMNALAHGALKGFVAPATDAGFFVRCDVGGVDSAKRCIQAQTARIGCAAFSGVADHAIACNGNQAATLNRQL